jgi:hypothetical protein
MNNSESFEVIGLIVLIVSFGIGFVFYPLKKIIEGRIIKTNGRQTYGEVVDNVRKENADGGMFYHPVIHFTTIDGDLVEYESDSGYAEKVRIGKRLKVYYMPEEPTRVYIADYSVLFYVFFLLTGLAAVTFLIISLTKTI